MAYQINQPVICIQASGNVRDKAKSWKYTRVAYFDAIEKKTFIFFVAPYLSGSKRTLLKKKMKQYAKQRNVNVLSIEYHLQGVEIMQAVSQN